MSRRKQWIILLLLLGLLPVVASAIIIGLVFCAWVLRPYSKQESEQMSRMPTARDLLPLLRQRKASRPAQWLIVACFSLPLVVALLGIALGSGANAQDQPTPPSGTRTLYDASGRINGTATTEDRVTTFRDGSGRMTGTAERLPDGRTEFRDAQGRLTGTTSK
jgi:hypothetical protein